MKKLFTLFTLSLLCLAATSNANNFIVSGASLTSENGIYVQAGTFNTKPYYVFNLTYYIQWSGSQWVLGSNCCGVNTIFFPDCTDDSTSSACPTSGWSCGGLSVTQEGDNLSYSGTKVVESENNDGTIPSVVTITLNAVSSGQAFTGADGEDYASNAKIIFSNFPSGLRPHAIKAGNAITLSFTGSAISNLQSDDGYMRLQFDNRAFANDTAANVVNSLDSIYVQFRQEYTVASTGADFTSVGSALAAVSAYDIISVSGETFTEHGLNVNTAVLIKGQGANKTIIQADTTSNTAVDRVFIINASDTVEFRDLTIRYGNATSGNGEGGAINSLSAPVNIYNCALTGNSILSNGSAYGGAIYAGAPLKIVASLIAGNSAVSYTNCWGGAINCTQLDMVNSTITGNGIMSVTTSYGTAIYAIHGPVNILNCTIDGNFSSGGDALSIDEVNDFNLTNSIVYGNTGGNDVALMNGTTWNASDCVTGASSTAAINGTNYNVSTLDPLLSPLADNGGTTQTMALDSGSWAINEGATGDSIPTTDQRGYGENGIRDVGAFEYDGIPPCDPNGDSATAAICFGDSIFLGGAYQMTAGTYHDTLTNVGGCDSIIVTALTVNPNNTSHGYAYICNGDSIFLGGGYQTVPNTYYSHFTNIYGCDSVIITDLVVNPVDTTSRTFSICSGGDYNFYGTPLSAAGTYYHALTSSATGCDSVIALTLLVDTIDLTVTVSGDTLSAVQPNATYQWVTCSSNGNAPIGGEMNSSYIATQSGSYAVIIVNGGCYGSSACQSVTVTGIKELMAIKGIVIYPNPASIFLSVTNITRPTTIRLYDILGKLALEEQTASDLIINTSQLSAGAYTLVADDGKTRSFNRVVIAR